MSVRTATLSPEKIVKAAITLVEARGVESLSMRKLATRLGVVPMAFYNYFQDRDALLDAIAEYVLQSLTPAAAHKAWRPRLVGLFREVRRFRTEQPNTFQLAMSRPTHARTIAGLVNSFMQAFLDAGLSEKDAAMCCHTFSVFLHGFPVWEKGKASQCKPALPPADDGSPAVSELITHVNPDKQFDASINWLLDSVEALAARKRATE